MTPSATCTTAANPWLSHVVRIASITEEIAGVATYHLSFVDPSAAAAYTFRPGQFNMLYLPGVGESAISLSADPRSRETWAHTVRVAGNVTTALSLLEPGGTLGLRGPFGTGWPLNKAAGKHVILVAGGIGLPPLRPVICHILDNRQNFLSVTLLYGARTLDGLLYTREFADWTQRGLAIQTTVDRAASETVANFLCVPRGGRLRRDRSPARTALPPLCCGCLRAGDVRENRAPDLPESTAN